MGIAERDYARPERVSAYGPGLSRARVGRFRAMSVTGWLILINVMVFVLANIVLARVPTRVSAGLEFNPGVTSEQTARARVVPEDRQHPQSPGVYYHPIVDGATGALIGKDRFLIQPVLLGWGHLSTGKLLSGEVWRLLTFQFLHANEVHLLFNMLGLWFVGGLVEQYLGSKRYLAFYTLAGIFGALTYLALNLLGYVSVHFWPTLKGRVPALLFDDIFTPLIGASAGVFGVLMAAAYIAPSAIVQVFFVIPMKLRTAVYLFLGLAMLNLLQRGANAGGDAAHVGGALAGAFFIRRTHLLREFFDVLGNSRLGRKPPHSTRPVRAEQELDRILDKVRSEGLESLTDTERGVLRRASGAG